MAKVKFMVISPCLGVERILVDKLSRKGLASIVTKGDNAIVARYGVNKTTLKKILKNTGV